MVHVASSIFTFSHIAFAASSRRAKVSNKNRIIMAWGLFDFFKQGKS
jgi:hypothetical protein